MLGEGHPNVISLYKNIAVVLEHLGDHKQALEYQQKAQQSQVPKTLHMPFEGFFYINSRQ